MEVLQFTKSVNGMIAYIFTVNMDALTLDLVSIPWAYVYLQ